MDEKKLQWIEISKLFWVILFASLYAWGGVEHKWLRRFIAPVVLSTGMFVYSRDWRAFIQAPVMMFTLAMGYGATTVWGKFGRRLLWAVCNQTSSMIFPFAQLINHMRKRTGGEWLAEAEDTLAMFLLHLMVGVLAIVVLGIFNPLPSARVEELCIGVLISLCPMFGTEVKTKDSDA